MMPSPTSISTNNDQNDPNIMGMSSKQKTVTLPNGQKELIIETTIQKFDGTTETRIERKKL
jgi:hypothetical protein